MISPILRPTWAVLRFATRRVVVAAWCAASLLAGGAALAQTTASITNLGSLTANSRAYFVSADGSVVGGLSDDRSFRWFDGDMADLGSVAGAEHPVIASAGSEDGSVVAGTSDSDDALTGQSLRTIVRWTAGGGAVNLGVPPISASLNQQWDWGHGPAISGDGNVIVAMSSGDDGTHILRWTAGTDWVDLGPPPIGIATGWDLGSAQVNFDGSVIVANANGNGFLRWTAEEGAWSVPPEGWTNYATSISRDGSVVVGFINNESRNHVFRWTLEGGLQDLGEPPGELWNLGDRLLVSGDGNVVVGSAFDSESEVERAFRWSAETGMQDLGTLDEDLCSSVAGVSFDGSVVTGDSWTMLPDSQVTTGHRAFIWTSESGMHDLGALPGGATDSASSAIDHDGAVIVGVLARVTQPGHVVESRAFRWDATSGVVDLGALPASLDPGDLSGDGSLVVGRAGFGDFIHAHGGGGDSGGHAFAWTAGSGIMAIDLEPDERDARAVNVSDDGTRFIGVSLFHDESDGAAHRVVWRRGGEGSEYFSALEGDSDACLHMDGVMLGPDDSASGGRHVSDDGSIVVGTSLNIDPQSGHLIRSRAVLWDDEGSVFDLGTLAGDGQNSMATAVSGDGSTVVGASAGLDDDLLFAHRAFRWTASNGMQDLGTLPGTDSSIAFFASRDGAAVVGSCFSLDLNSGQRYGYRAFRWSAGSMLDLGSLPGDNGRDDYWPVWISDDGATVLGLSQHRDDAESSTVTRRAFLWKAGAGMAALPAELTHLHDMSLDGAGTLVAGARDGESGTVACIWTAATGLRDLRAALADLGVGVDGWDLRDCGVSRDGLALVGTHLAAGRMAVFQVSGFQASRPTNVVAWGFGDFGQTSVPPMLGDCTAVSAGVYFSLALRTDGTVAAWGRDDMGQCEVPADLGLCKAVSAGGYHAVALRTDGSVVCWGGNNAGQCDVPAGLGPCKAIAAGRYHTLALKMDGTVVAWGGGATNAGGFIEHGQSIVPQTLGACKAIAAGGFHSMAIRNDGTVVAWGSGYQGAGNSTVPPGLGACKAIAAGFDHSLALRADGAVIAWGGNPYGQTNVPADLGHCKVIAAGVQHSLAIREDGTAVGWGLDDYGQSEIPADLGSCMGIAGGGYHTLALKTIQGEVILAPTDVAASDGTSTAGVTVGWSASQGADSYQVYRTLDGAPALIATTLTASFFDTTAAPGVQYAYSVKAVGAAGVSDFSASDTGYRHVAAPTAVAASAGSSTGEVTLTWSASAGATSYQIFRDGGPSPVGTVSATTYHDTGAPIGVIASYTVRAVYAIASISQFSDLSAPAASGWRAPAAPAGLAASDGTSTSKITVSWNAVPGATGYEVTRNGVVIRSPAVQTTTSFDDVVAVGSSFTYSVRAAAPAGFGPMSGADTGFINCGVPTGVDATDGVYADRVAITWNAVPNAVAYQIFRSGTSGAIGLTNALSFNDTTGAVGTTYNYWVKAVTQAGLASDPIIAGAASLINAGYRKVAAPSGVDATNGLADKVVVTWSAVEGATGYYIYRTTGSTTTLAGTVTGNGVVSYEDKGGALGTLFTYTVKALSLAGLSDASAGKTGYRMAAPVGVVASDGAFPDKVFISWSATTNATGYKIIRRVSAGDAGTVVATITGGATLSGSDAAADPGVIYLYSVRANSSAGYGPESAADTGYRGAPPPSGVVASRGDFETSIRVQWNPIAGAAGYEILRNGVSIGRVNSGATTPTFIDIDTVAVAPNTSYTYTVKSCFAGGLKSAASVGSTGWRGPSPKGVNASNGLYADRVDIAWSKIADVSTYRVYRNGVQLSLKISGSGSNFLAQDTTAVPGVTYSYTVRAALPLGLGPASACSLGSRKSAVSTLVDGDAAGGGAGGIGGAGPAVSGGKSTATGGGIAAGTGTATQAAGAGSTGEVHAAVEHEACDALFLKLAERIALEQGRVDAANVAVGARAQDAATAMTQLAVVNALSGGEVDGRSLIDELTAQLTLDENGDGVLDICQRANGDIDLDGEVNDRDWAAFLDAFELGDLRRADLNRDGEIDGADIGLMLLLLPDSDHLAGTLPALDEATATDTTAATSASAS